MPPRRGRPSPRGAAPARRRGRGPPGRDAAGADGTSVAGQVRLGRAALLDLLRGRVLQAAAGGRVEAVLHVDEAAPELVHFALHGLAVDEARLEEAGDLGHL